MKRRDWRTKNLKEGIYGKLKVNRRFFFLRKLNLRRYRTLVKRNLILNYHYFSNLLYNLKKLKKSHINYIFSKHTDILIFLPDFTFKKKVNNLFPIFKKIQKQFNFRYFINKKPKKHNKSSFGFNLKILKNFNESFFEEFLMRDEYKNVISKKFLNNGNNQYYLNFYFNYNSYLNNTSEIYKILIILYLNKVL